jgi:hypothetical protein
MVVLLLLVLLLEQRRVVAGHAATRLDDAPCAAFRACAQQLQRLPWYEEQQNEMAEQEQCAALRAALLALPVAGSMERWPSVEVRLGNVAEAWQPCAAALGVEVALDGAPIGTRMPLEAAANSSWFLRNVRSGDHHLLVRVVDAQGHFVASRDVAFSSKSAGALATLRAPVVLESPPPGSQAQLSDSVNAIEVRLSRASVPISERVAIELDAPGEPTMRGVFEVTARSPGIAIDLSHVAHDTALTVSVIPLDGNGQDLPLSTIELTALRASVVVRIVRAARPFADNAVDIELPCEGLECLLLPTTRAHRVETIVIKEPLQGRRVDSGGRSRAATGGSAVEQPPPQLAPPPPPPQQQQQQPQLKCRVVDPSGTKRLVLVPHQSTVGDLAELTLARARAGASRDDRNWRVTDVDGYQIDLTDPAHAFCDGSSVLILAL